MTEEKAFEIYVDRQQPPRLSYDDTNGEPILAYHGPQEGWVLHVEHYQPFPMKVTDFDRAFEALAKARTRGEPGTDIIELLQRCWTGDAVAGLVTRIKASGVDYRFSSYY